MNTLKAAQAKDSQTYPEPVEIDNPHSVPGKLPEQEELPAPVPVEDLDTGTDPYNSTGHQFILQPRKDDLE